MGFAALLIAASAFVDAGSRGRALIAITGVASYLVARELQKDGDRLYGVNRSEDEAYDSLWGPGLAAVLVCGVAQAVVLVAVL